MRITDFGADVASAIGDFGSIGASHAPIAQTDGACHVACLRLAPGGSIGRHPTVLSQLFCVVSGEGTVSGEDGVTTPIRAGQAASWDPGEQHAAASDTGMTALVLEAVSRISPR